MEGLPYDLPPPPDLPTCRVSDDPLFAHTGLDFARPLHIREPVNQEGDTKVYVCLFTCASTCAIHLELTHELNKDTFLLAFKSFSKELQSIYHSPEAFQYLTNQCMSWKFIVARAKW